MILLLTLIVVAGHYAGIAVVMFVLLRFVSREGILFSLALTAGVTVVIFLMFELGFDIELHRGAIFRIWDGDSVL
jgi:pantothenate synthetase